MKTDDLLTYPCTVCSANPGESCRDRRWEDCEPHAGRKRLAGVLYED